MQEQSIFIEALEREDPAERAAFLDRVCAGDQALRDRIERLLRRHEQGGSFLDAPAPPLDAVAEPTREGPGGGVGPDRLREQPGAETAAHGANPEQAGPSGDAVCRGLFSEGPGLEEWGQKRSPGR
jgi:hypothetical protein